MESSAKFNGRRLRAVVAGSIGLAAVAAASVVASSGAAATSRPQAASAEVKLAMNAKLGDILVDAKGYTLYRYTPDKFGVVACTGGCAAYWPPLTLPTGATKAVGAKGVSGLGTVKDPNGKLQVTYRGHPLYTYAGDSKPGQIRGQGVQGTWYVVTKGVKPLTAKATTSTTGGGY